MKELDEKVILVTGATSGIGKASAILFAQNGAKVAVVGRRTEEGEAVVAEIAKEGGSAVFIQADLADLNSIVPIVDSVVKKFGRLDAAFNNAGMGNGRKLIAERTAAEWDTLFDLNLKSAFFCLQAQVAQFRKQKSGGSILFNASILGSVGFTGTVIYGVTKGGIITLARGAAVELGPENIRVNTVSPAITRTAMTAVGYVKGADGNDTHPMDALTPLRRSAEPIEIAQAASFLLSDRASFITGHDLVIDGGLTAS